MPTGEYERFEDPEEYARVRMQRKIKAFVHHTRGLPYWRIADKMTISMSHVKELIDEMYEDITIPPEEEVRKLAQARLEAELAYLHSLKATADARSGATISAQIRATVKELVALHGYAKPIKFDLRNRVMSEMDANIEELMAVELATQLKEEAEKNARRNADI